ncbi:FG-GAP-like repeat-containing protein [Flavobacterium sp.]|uniref:FG-GAP-like repeat-containing protein n=1 Tax=Flavobacterium sp. TaxID=239 RepID=UPI00333FF946
MKKIIFIFVQCLFSIWSFAQDTCASAIPITAGLNVVTAVNGTDIPSPICASNGVIAGTNGKGEWYSYTPTQNYTVTISTNISQNNPLVDTRFHVYTGTCGNLTCFAGDDDSGTNYSSFDVFNVTAGTTYIIAFDNRWSSNGFTFQLIENPLVVPTPQRITYTTQNIATVNSTYNLCVVDMNGDRKDDIAGVSASNLRIHYQGTGGTFTNSDFPITGTSNMPSWSLAAGDYNKDGYNDLILGGGSAVTFWKSNSTGTAYSNETFSQYVFCQRTNFVDLNNDGNLDAFSCHDVDPNVYFINNGSGVLTFYQSGVTPGATTMGIHTEGGNYGSIFVDYDNDGDQDLFIAKCRGGAGTAKFNEMHRNNGNGTFTDVSIEANLYDPIQTWSSAWADYDNDGDLDIVVGASSTADGNHKYMRNNGNGTFTDITSGSGWDTNASTSIEHVAHDFDNDGFVDVLGGGNKIMFNLGNGTFAPSNYSAIAVGGIGDLNNDGFLDFLNGSNVRYAIPNSNNWLKVTLQGIASNSYGIGARVEIYGAFGKQIRDIHSGDGFKYMSSLNAHFGIGAATAITKIKVIWPSGTVDIITNPNINQTVNVIEGNFPLNASSFNGKEVVIFPNPTSDYLTISNIEQLDVNAIQIIDTNGKTISRITSNFNSIDVSNLSNGIYILSIETKEGKKFAENFIKK